MVPHWGLEPQNSNRTNLTLTSITRFPYVESHTGTTALMAGELGFEPRFRESKSRMLPLHYSPIIAMYLLHTLKIYKM